jgi:hypothetical protein
LKIKILEEIGEEKKMCNREVFVVFRIFLGRIWSGFTSFIFFTQIVKEKADLFFTLCNGG